MDNHIINEDTRMIKQLIQLFEYAELIVRLNHAKELLEPQDGYNGERELVEGIESVKSKIYVNMKQHLSNSGVSERAMTLINNMVIYPDIF